MAPSREEKKEKDDDRKSRIHITLSTVVFFTEFYNLKVCVCPLSNQSLDVSCCLRLFKGISCSEIDDVLWVDLSILEQDVNVFSAISAGIVKPFAQVIGIDGWWPGPAFLSTDRPTTDDF